jgi:hypothetical protein
MIVARKEGRQGGKEGVGSLATGPRCGVTGLEEFQLLRNVGCAAKARCLAIYREYSLQSSEKISRENSLYRQDQMQ